jgi:membrane protein implicated in regulation of membrane protease activity
MSGRKSPWTFAAVLMAALKALPGVLVVALGGWALSAGVVNLTDRDADGYVMFEPVTFARPSAAIIMTNEPLGGEGRLGVLGGGLRCRANADGTVHQAIEAGDVFIRIQGVNQAPGALFLGVAPAAAVDQYLAGVAHDKVTAQGAGGAQCGEQIDDVVYAQYDGTELPATPGAETIWEASAEGTGLVTLDFTLPTEGEWAAVVMNADGSPGITADLALGAKASNITAIALSRIAIGVCALLAGGLAVLAAALRLRGMIIGLGLAVAGIAALGSVMGLPYFLGLPMAAAGLVLVAIGMKRARDAHRSEAAPPAEHDERSDVAGS